MASAKRILFLIADEFPTHRPDVTVLFGAELSKHGIHSDLVAQWRRGSRQDGAHWAAGEAYVCGRSGSRVRDQIAAFWHDLRCLWKARAEDYDAIQVRNKVFAGILGLIRARQLQLPFFYWMSFPMSEGFIELARQQGVALGWVRWTFMSVKGHVGRYLIYHWLLPRSDQLFVQSDRMADDLARRGLHRDRMTVVPMGVDFAAFRAFARDPQHQCRKVGDSPVIAYLGAMDRSRGLDFLLEVLLVVRQRFPHASLMFVGDATEPQDRTWLDAKADQFGLHGAIACTGWIPRDEAWRRLTGADVAVSPIPRSALFDCSSPTKVVEYLALGLPVVANDIPDQHKVLTESGAGICVETDVNEFARAIIRILDDPVLSAGMRRAGPEYVARHRSYSVLGARVALVYRRLLTGAGCQRAACSSRE